MENDRRRAKEENKIVTSLVNAFLMGIAWWVIILAAIMRYA